MKIIMNIENYVCTLEQSKKINELLGKRDDILEKKIKRSGIFLCSSHIDGGL